MSFAKGWKDGGEIELLEFLFNYVLIYLFWQFKSFLKIQEFFHGNITVYYCTFNVKQSHWPLTFEQ